MNLVKITDFMSEEMINMNMKANGKEEAIKELAGILSKSENVSDAKGCYDDLVAREKLGTTGIGKGVAIPHAKTEAASKLTISFGKSVNGVNYDALDQKKVNLFFIFASPVEESKTYLKILARISRLVRNDDFRNKLLKAETANDILNLIDSEEKNR
jgi:fructose-specific phosphotransferase system IIA component